jgi:hypothetical protein
MTHTKGNVIVEDIKIGDIHYEFEYGMCIKTEVISLPVRNDDGLWSWQSKSDQGTIIDYAVHEKYAHYGPNLYDYIAYQGCQMM